MKPPPSPRRAGGALPTRQPRSRTNNANRNVTAISPVATEPESTAPASLAESAKVEINRLHGEICDAARTSIEKAIRIGELLTQARSSLKHGEWLPWLKENVGFSRQTADNYWRIFDNRENLKLLNVGNLTDAYRLLANSQNDRQLVDGPDETAADILDESELMEFRVWKLGRRLDAVCLKPVEKGTLDDIKELRAIITEANALGQWWHEYQLRAEKNLGELLIELRPVASAIAEIRDNRLYRETYASFAEYCEKEIEMSESQTNKMLSLALVHAG
jgi:hypothetical protein